MLKNSLIISLFLTSFATFAVTKIVIAPATSKLVYLAKKVTGEHTGEVKLANGFLNFDKDTLVSGEFEIDMTTISNSDIKDQEYHTKFLNHMISDDFFAVKQFKTAKFVIKSAKKMKADNYEIKGDLTIKGKTDAIAFDAVANQKEAHAKIIFDRTKFDIKYGSANFFKSIGDKAINDKVELDVVLTAKK